MSRAERSVRASRRGVPVWTFLLVLALLPTLGMAALAVGEARESARTARHAGVVAQDAADLVHAMDLASALGSEQLPTQAMLRSDDFNVSVEQASTLLGFDIEQRYETARRSTDRALAAVPPALVQEYPQLAEVGTRLTQVRAAADQEEPDEVAVYLETLALSEIAEDVALAELDELTNGNALVDPEAARALQAFAAVVATFETSQQELLAITEVLFSGGAHDEVLDLAYATAEYRRESSKVARHDDSPVAAQWADVAAAPAAVRFAAWVESTLADPTWLSTSDPQRVASVIADGFARSDLLAALNRDAGQRGVAAARAAEQRAHADHGRTIVVSVLFGAVSLAFAGLLSWSISRPLHRVARRATHLSEGELDRSEPSAGGPREVRTVAEALEEAADNLRRVEQQAKALAAGDLDHAVLDAAVPGVLGESVQASVLQLSRSIREQDELRQRLARQAHHDPLTGLLNRAGFLTALDDALEQSRFTGSQVGLFFIDLDGFKRANDSHGHTFGDDVLRLTARRIATAARGQDLIARLGGDEFVVIAEAVGGAERALRLGERLAAAVSEPIELEGRSALVGASIGVAVSSDLHQRAADLLADADQAVYRAKRAGRGRVELCNDELRREVAERNQIEVALRAGIRKGELELHYQPVVDTSNQQVRGFEALVRWRRPGYGLVPPVSFIPVAEASDLVVDLGRWVLLEATTQLARWSGDPAFAGLHVSVNVSGRHLLNRAVVDDVRHALERSGLEPHRLVVEITETVILSDLDVAVQHLEALRALGVRIALDDFGTGYTSIGQLGRLPVDILKIDRAFVSEIQQAQDRTIVELMVEVAHTLGLGLVAEGVEDAGQLEVLRELTCDDVQGYLISRPLEAGDARSWASPDDDTLAAPASGSDASPAPSLPDDQPDPAVRPPLGAAEWTRVGSGQA